MAKTTISFKPAAKRKQCGRSQNDKEPDKKAPPHINDYAINLMTLRAGLI